MASAVDDSTINIVVVIIIIIIIIIISTKIRIQIHFFSVFNLDLIICTDLNHIALFPA